MKIRLPAKELKYALTGLTKVIDRSNPLPILHCVRIECAEGIVRFSATDLDRTVSCISRKAEILTDGIIAVDLNRLKHLIRKPGKDSVLIEALSDQRLSITLEGPLGVRDHMLQYRDAQDLPDLPIHVPVQKTSCRLHDYIRKALPFTSKDPNRDILNAVSIEPDKTGCILVATDGRRMTVYESLDQPFSEPLIIPAHPFLSWSSFNGEECRVGLHKNQIRIEVGLWSFQSKLVEGTYPNWRQVMPQINGAPSFTLADDDIPILQDAIDSLPGFEDKTSTVVLIRHQGHMQVGACDPDSGWIMRDLPKTKTTGKIGIAVGRRFLKQAVDAGFRKFHSQDELSPLLGFDEDRNRHVLMPVREALPEPKEIPATTAKPVTQPKKDEKPMIQSTEDNQTPNPDPVEQLEIVYQEVRTKSRDLNQAITTLGQEIRNLKKQDKAVKSELHNARGVLKKLQAVSL